MWPREGYRCRGDPPVEPNVCPDRFVITRAHPADRRNLAEKEVCIVHNWNLSRFPIRAIESAPRTVILAGLTASHVERYHAATGTASEWIEAFDQPGQWYLIVSAVCSQLFRCRAKTLSRRVVAPRHATVITLAGDVEVGTTVGISFFAD